MSVQMFDVGADGYNPSMDKALSTIVAIPARPKKLRRRIDLRRFNPCNQVAANVLHIGIRAVIGLGALAWVVMEFGR